MTETHPKITAGIDVGKSHLELSISAGPTQTYANDPEGIAALTLELAAQSPPIALTVYEPTGGYERLLATMLAESGLPACRVHPNKVRAYARACGQQAKTDRLDAQILSRYAAAFDLPPDPSSETDDAGVRAQLKDLLRRREQLVAQRTADKCRLDKGQSDEAKASAERHIAWLDEEIARLEKAYQSLLSESPALSETAALYQSVPGVGQLTAATLVAELPELGRIDGKSAAALVGLAPWSRDSGRQRGRRSIQGGRGKVRRVLYLAAQSAARHNAGLREFYQGLRARGKPGKVALTAVMRKLVMQLNAITVRGTPWAPEPAHTPALAA